MKETENGGGFFFSALKGIINAVIITLVGVLIFAAVIKIASLGKGVIKAVNQFIKIIAIFLGCSFSVRQNNGALKGGIIGAGATAVTYLLFALIGGGAEFGFGFLFDLIFGIIVGGISGIISVNVKK